MPDHTHHRRELPTRRCRFCSGSFKPLRGDAVFCQDPVCIYERRKKRERERAPRTWVVEWNGQTAEFVAPSRGKARYMAAQALKDVQGKTFEEAWRTMSCRIAR